MKKISAFAAIVMITLEFSACGSDTFEPTCNSATISFASEVKPIIDSKCATNSGCHASGSSRGTYTTYSQISSDKGRISSTIKNGSMPQNGSLTTNQKNTILCWIENGAPNN
jgi:hypothetical protein